MSALSAKRSHRHRPKDPKDDRERYYLLPGQGGSGYRRKQRFILKSSIIVGIVVSLLLAVTLYLVSR